MSRKKVSKIVIIGDSAVGKTSLMSSYVDQKFSQSHKATIGADFMEKEVFVDGKSIILDIWDTAGQDRFKCLGNAFYRGSDVCVLVYDITDKKSFENIQSWRSTFLENNTSVEDELKYPFVLIGNKIDLQSKREVDKTLVDQLLLKYPGMPHYQVSAKNRLGVAQVFEKIAILSIQNKKEQVKVYCQAQIQCLQNKFQASGQKQIEEETMLLILYMSQQYIHHQSYQWGHKKIFQTALIYSLQDITYIYLYIMSDLSGKVAIITASSTGIGKGIAESLGKAGVKVVISSRSKKNVDETVSELKAKGYEAFGVVCHVGKKEDRTKLIDQTIKQYGKINFLVPNAAVSTQLGSFLEGTEEQIQKMWDVNFKSTFFLVQQALPHLRKEKGNSIVIISSQTAYLLPSIIGHYAITKTALVALTKILAKELLDDEIRVNCVCPGLIKTKFSNALWSGAGEQQAAELRGVKRLGVPQDIGGVVKFLCCKESIYMTGQSLVVAGQPIARL